MRKMIVAAVAAAMTLALAAPATAGKPSWAEAAKPGDQTIVQIALASSDFDVLVAAVSRAGLVPLLNGDGDFTVFAPTDAAFEATFGASEADIITMINDGDLDGALGNILGYHVTEGRRTSKSVLSAGQFQMLNGDKLTLGELVTAGIDLGASDISASNGIVHVLTAGVLLP
ncbi:MAG: fasciclin domain-containing protein [Acidimicrobiia bacterium]|nr:fasciclin domain-containing protein [Acidimicrobiia bacterium]